MATEVASAYVELSARTAALEAGLARANASVASFAKGADQTAARSSAAWSTIGRTAKIGGLAVAAGLAASVKVAASFEKQMSQVRAVSGANSQQYQKLSKAAMDLGASTKFSAREVAAAQTELAKAGMNVGQILGGGLKASLALAAAGNMDLAAAAASVSDAMGVFKLKAASAVSIADALAMAANITTADVAEFSMGLENAGGAAKQAGMSFNQTMTALTLLAKAGTKGAEAGTNVKSFLANITSASPKAEAEMQRLGLRFFDARGNIKSLADISGMLRDKLKNQNAEQRLTTANLIAGSYGAKTFLALLNTAPATIRRYSGELAKSGTAAKTAAIMNDNFAGRLEQLKGALETLGIGIGNVLLPPLSAFVTGLTALIGKISAFKPLAIAAGTAVTVMVAAFAVSKVVAFGKALTEVGLIARTLSVASTITQIGTAYAGAAVGAGKFAQQATVFDKHVAPVGRFSKATNFAKQSLNGLAAGMPFGPLGMLTGAAIAGAAGLLLFGQRTNGAAERQANLARISQEAAAAVGLVASALERELTAIDRVKASTDKAKDARKRAADAARDYAKAEDEGPKAGEKQVAYIARLNALLLTKIRTENAAGMATKASSAEVDRLTKQTDNMARSTSTSIGTLQAKRRELAAQAGTLNMAGASEDERNKVALNTVKVEGQLGTALRNRSRELANNITVAKASRDAIRASAADDTTKAAAVDAVNRSINKMSREAKAIAGTKLTPEIKMATDEPNKRLKVLKGNVNAVPKSINITASAQTSQAAAAISAIKSAVDNIDKSFEIVATFVTRGTPPKGGNGGFRGGYAQHLARGGKVSGPAGRDVIPAMLTAGEVVLTKAQQAMVNRGMSIRDAIRRTGGAYTRGGFVPPTRKRGEKDGPYQARVEKARKAYQDTQATYTAPPKAKPIKREQGETDKAYNKRKAKARADQLKADRKAYIDRRDKANEPVKTAAKGIGDAISTVALKRYDEETQKSLNNIARQYQGGYQNINGTWTRITGSVEQADKDTNEALKRIERNFTGTFVNAMGQSVTGSFRDFDIQMRTAQQSLTKFYDALTPAEAQIKAMQDSASQSDLAGAVTDAQAKLKDAQDFGDPAAIAAARKAVDDAVRAQTIAGLQTTAEAERAQREADRQQAQDAFDKDWDGRRQALQDQLDGQLEQRRIDGENTRMLLEAQMAEQQAIEQAKRDNERAMLEGRLAEMMVHFDTVKAVSVSKTKDTAKTLRGLGTAFLASGRNLGENFADGITDVLPKIKEVGKDIASILRDYLKTGSPTKKGPMSNLDKWWDGFVPALEQGLDDAKLAGDIAAATAPGATGSGAGGGGKVQVINLTVTDSTFAGMSREQADRVAREIQAALDRQVRATL